MSRHDPRRALTLRLPEELRLKIVQLTTDRRPLPGLMRRALRQGLQDVMRHERAPLVHPGVARPILLQLSSRERALLSQYALMRGCCDEIAALTLMAASV